MWTRVTTSLKVDMKYWEQKLWIYNFSSLSLLQFLYLLAMLPSLNLASSYQILCLGTHVIHKGTLSTEFLNLKNSMDQI